MSLWLQLVAAVLLAAGGLIVSLAIGQGLFVALAYLGIVLALISYGANRRDARSRSLRGAFAKYLPPKMLWEIIRDEAVQEAHSTRPRQNSFARAATGFGKMIYDLWLIVVGAVIGALVAANNSEIVALCERLAGACRSEVR